MPANILTIPSSAPFAETLARGLIARLGAQDDPLALSAVTIYLPTRRAVRTLAETFARALGGAALLPVMRPLGDVDEDAFVFDPLPDDMALPPAIAPLRRRFLLARLVQRWHAQKGEGALDFAQAASLAGGLARFLDEAQTQDADLSRLDGLAQAELAEHWENVRDFLVIVRDAWPQVLADEGKIDPADFRNRSIRALARRYRQKPPAGPVIAAGSTGSIPATADLLRVIAELANGSVILPGLDRALDEKSWNALDENHPQYGMKQLLAGMGVERADVSDWQPAPAALPQREAVLRETLRPAPTTDAWRALAEGGAGAIANGLDGVSLIEAAHPGEEALAIALILRETLETKGQTAALVTPDRNLARRVAAEMLRWDIAIDDSAGRPLSKTPPGAFLSLLADAAESGFAPVALLALLKHPLAAGGEEPSRFRTQVRTLDRLVLRGPRPDPGLASLGDAILHASEGERIGQEERDAIRALTPWFAGVAAILSPLEEAMSADACALADIVDVQMSVAERLAATDRETGANRLWSGEAGETAADLLTAMAEANAGLPPVEPRAWPALLRTLANESAVRPAFGRHPRLSILGPLEARLQSFDVVVLGALNEGTWPRAAAADPWLSRPMRKTVGLESPERAHGLAAHDFATLAAGPRVYLTRAQKVDGTPTVASRWLQRLDQLTQGLGLKEKLASGTQYLAFAKRLNEPDAKAPPIKKPAPTPPVAARPRKLSVTEIETWMRDPYAIYARHILELKPLDPLEAEIGPLERGNTVHAALETFLIEFADSLPTDAQDRLIAIGREIFRDAGIPRSTLAVWLPRFEQAARWFVAEERARHAGIARSFVELRGRRVFAGPAGDFTLRCRADRIDILKSGGAAIVDYKTGNPPSGKQVRFLWSPQLPLEGAILRAGGFAEIGAIEAGELLYIKFSGGTPPGKIEPVKDDISALVAKAEDVLEAMIAAYDDSTTPYRSRVKPLHARISGHYDHLARVSEWSLSGWEDGDE